MMRIGYKLTKRSTETEEFKNSSKTDVMNFKTMCYNPQLKTNVTGQFLRLQGKIRQKIKFKKIERQNSLIYYYANELKEKKITKK